MGRRRRYASIRKAIKDDGGRECVVCGEFAELEELMTFVRNGETIYKNVCKKCHRKDSRERYEEEGRSESTTVIRPRVRRVRIAGYEAPPEGCDFCGKPVVVPPDGENFHIREGDEWWICKTCFRKQRGAERARLRKLRDEVAVRAGNDAGLTLSEIKSRDAKLLREAVLDPLARSGSEEGGDFC